MDVGKLFDFRNVLAPVVASPALQAVLNAAGILQLEPLKHWGWGNSQPLTYVVTTASSAIAILIPARTNTGKAILIVVGLVVLLIAWAAYTWVSTAPPATSNLWLYEVTAYTSFFLTYISFGFVTARTVKFFTQSPR